MATKSQWMTVNQAAAALGESASTTFRRIESGGLPAERLDGRKGMFLIAREHVDRLIAERAAELRAEADRLESAAS